MKYIAFPKNNRFLVELCSEKTKEVEKERGKLDYSSNSNAVVVQKHLKVNLLDYSGEEEKFNVCPCVAIIDSNLLETIWIDGEEILFCSVSALICILEEQAEE
jgi:hypothetical protein